MHSLGVIDAFWPAKAQSLALSAMLLLGVGIMNRNRWERARGGSPSVTRECRLEQEWQTGDVYDWEWLTFERRGTGSWIQGDRHGEERRVAFRWKRDRTTLTLTSERESRTVHYEIEAEGDGCILRFDRSPVSSASTTFYGNR